jgi:histone H3/H4
MSEEAAIEAAQADGRDFVTEADVQQADAQNGYLRSTTQAKI